MTDYLTLIGERFPVRRTRAQQAAFLDWLGEELRTLGCTVRSETCGPAGHRVLTAGKPDRSGLLLLVRPDTPARWLLPELTVPCNAALWALWQLVHIALLLVPALGVYLLVWHLTGGAVKAALWGLVAVYVGLLALMRWGPANRRNAGFDADLAAALTLIAELGPEDRRKAAFLFADRGGARAWAKEHAQTAWTRLVLQLCRIGRGSHLVCLTTAAARRATGCGSLLRAVGSADGLTPVIADGRWSPLRGERRAFRCGLTLCACRRSPVLGLWAYGGHTPGDRRADPGNIAQVCRILGAFLTKIQLTD
ncbi:MAG: hypothetical protein IJK28_05875 [Clostridia bacterium]|nr:hypothetical protein [Clostridia bacterium]